MQTQFPKQLPGSLRKYEPVIDQVIADMGIRGKVDEFQQEGRIAVYQAQDTLYSDFSDLRKDADIEMTIREHFRNLLG